MRCTICVSEGLSSTVTGGCGMSTMVYCPPFYDEQGKQHEHDRNATTTKYMCSRGHGFSQTTTGSCWCGWPTSGKYATGVLG